MSETVRLGAVDYLNARPLVYGIADGQPSGEPGLTLRFDPPSACARLLAAGEIDLGLVPTITYMQRSGDRVIPGVGIVSDGPVASVALFTRPAIRDVRSIALDTSSRTSAALTQILCTRVFHVVPSFVPHAPDLDAMLAAHDAALLIGDPALFADAPTSQVDKIDLGQTWTEWTGLPFVWAFWSGPGTAADSAVVRRLQSARDAGVVASDTIADAYCEGEPTRQAIARRYLRDHIKYDLSDRALRGLQRFYEEARAMGLVERVGPVEFF